MEGPSSRIEGSTLAGAQLRVLVAVGEVLRCFVGRKCAAQCLCLTFRAGNGTLGAMKNLTLKLDEQLLKRVRHIAVDEDLSVSAWVGGVIRMALRERDEYEASRKGALEDLDRPLALGGKPLSRDELHAR